MARILVVDDDPDVRELMQIILESGGHRPTIVSTGPQALAAAQEEPFDVALLDVRMEPMDGLEVATELHRGCPNLRIGMVTAADAPDSIAKAVAAKKQGVSRFLPKPLRRREVLGFVDSLLAQEPGDGDSPS
ncbi:MAG: response regulator [Armatimonadota bacterium]